MVGLGVNAADSISKFIGTRSVLQVRSHAQKHFLKEAAEYKASQTLLLLKNTPTAANTHTSKDENASKGENTSKNNPARENTRSMRTPTGKNTR
ncbi:hypothetical protein T484DRAFT_1791992, partial [Baffinella frigidus]